MTMRDFFKGWRRKTGCGLLVMALVVFGAWMRSHHHFDSLFIHTPSATHAMKSQAGRVGWTRMEPEASPTWMTWKSEQASEWQTVEFYRQSYCGFTFGTEPSAVMTVSEGEGFTRHRWDFWVIPHWAVVLPLALISAYLILWKPRRKVERDA
jgi:hypothetical protein